MKMDDPFQFGHLTKTLFFSVFLNFAWEHLGEKWVASKIDLGKYKR